MLRERELMHAADGRRACLLNATNMRLWQSVSAHPGEHARLGAPPSWCLGKAVLLDLDSSRGERASAMQNLTDRHQGRRRETGRDDDGTHRPQHIISSSRQAEGLTSELMFRSANRGAYLPSLTPRSHSSTSVPGGRPYPCCSSWHGTRTYSS